MRVTFTSFDEFLIERVFQPGCNLLAQRFGVARSSAAGFCVDVASLGWIVARVPPLSKEVVNWDVVPATLHLMILLVGLTALTGLRTLFRRQAGQRRANPLRQTMRPHRAILLVMLLARLLQFQAPGLTEFADAAMLVAAIAALYLGACAERPPVHRALFAAVPSAS
jgi:hypothetical protein